MLIKFISKNKLSDLLIFLLCTCLSKLYTWPAKLVLSSSTLFCKLPVEDFRSSSVEFKRASMDDR